MNDNLGIGVMSSVNFKERYTACKLTWLKDFNNTYIFGGNNANQVDSNLLSIESAGEDWESCFLKQQLGLKHMYEDNPNYDWYSISGCDNILFKDRLLKELSNYNPNDDFLISQLCGVWTLVPYLHECGGVENDNSFRSIAGGASFFISNDDDNTNSTTPEIPQGLKDKCEKFRREDPDLTRGVVGLYRFSKYDDDED
jgi:hypothetical protein